MEDVQKIVDRLRPIDDIFFQKLAENNKSSIPDDPRYPNVCNAIRSLKEGKGRENMCEEVEKYAQNIVAKEREKVAKESVIKMFQDGLDIEPVSRYVTGIAPEELEKMYKKVHG